MEGIGVLDPDCDIDLFVLHCDIDLFVLHCDIDLFVLLPTKNNNGEKLVTPPNHDQ